MKSKRIIGTLLALCMFIALFASTAFAGGVDEKAVYPDPPTDSVCKIDDNYFSSLKEAICYIKNNHFYEPIIWVLKDTEFDGSEDISSVDITIQSGYSNATITLTGPMKFGQNGEGRSFTLRGNHSTGTRLTIRPVYSPEGISFRPIAVRSGNTLTLENQAFLIGDDYKDGLGGMINVASGATFVLEGQIDNCKAAMGGAISVANGGRFIMNSGGISGCSANQGGAVYVANGGTCEIKRGEISSCKAVQGGAIFVAYGGKCTISSGTIKDCKATHTIEATEKGSSTSAAGGGVYVIGSLTMTGGSIDNCAALSGKGGGVYVYPESGRFEMSGGSIQNCKATENDDTELYYNDSEGGGVYIGKKAGGDDLHPVKVIGNAMIRYNKAAKGGGIYVHEGAEVSLNNDVNISDNSGGNVYLKDGAHIYLGDVSFSEKTLIGFTTETYPTIASPICLAKAAGSDLGKYFSPDVENTFTEYDSTNKCLLAKGYLKESLPDITVNAIDEKTVIIGNLKAGYNLVFSKFQNLNYLNNSTIKWDNVVPCTFTAYKAGDEITTVRSDNLVVEITRAQTPDLVPTQPATINGKGSIPTTTAHQKSTDGLNWTDCDGEWTNLDEGDYYVRVKASGTVLASEAQQITIAVEKNYVIFITYGGTPVPLQLVIDGDKATRPADPEKTSFKFEGWFADESLTVPFDFDSEINDETIVYAKWKEISYPISGGDNIKWVKDSGEDVEITVNRSDDDDTCFIHFIGVDIDGNPLVLSEDYMAVKGSTVVTIYASVLEKLQPGEHNVTINFDDGKTTATLTVKDAEPEPPQTGDNSHLGLWIVLSAISVSALALIVVIDKKKKVFER